MDQDISRSIEACAAHYGEDADAMRDYLMTGQARALELDNRGPIRFNEDGSLALDIRESYSRYGFYVFTDVVSDEEIEDLRNDIEAMRKRLPVAPDEIVDSYGNPALSLGCKAPNLLWSKPLGDPLGGSDLANGRHQVKLYEPKAAADAPAASPFILLGSLQFSEACLRAYAHPQLLKVAAAINGDDFAPFNETLFIKDPFLGAAVSWHQDGDTHWDNPDFDEDIHGFNFMTQVYGSTAVNGVWVLPGSHKDGHIDIKKLVAEAGSERLPGAVPMVCNAGDVIISNRQIVHGSFPNTGYEPRLTVNAGFHRRSSVLDVQGAGIHTDVIFYDDAFIKERTKVLGYGIDARRQRYPNETQYTYKPFENDPTDYTWNSGMLSELKDYNLRDLSI